MTYRFTSLASLAQRANQAFKDAQYQRITREELASRLHIIANACAEQIAEFEQGRLEPLEAAVERVLTQEHIPPIPLRPSPKDGRYTTPSDHRLSMKDL